MKKDTFSMQYPKDFHKIDNRLNLWLPSQNNYNFEYSDGLEKENYIENCVKQASDLSSHSSELAKLIRDWSSEYHLSPKRSNLLRPLLLNKGNSVLELGAGCGAITRYLGENVANVVAVEGSRKRAEITASRCRDLDNVNVVNAEFQELEIAEKFNIVTLIGVLEYSGIYIKTANPYRSLLEIARQYLTNTGILVLAIENKLGLKYFAGCSEDHTGLVFDGIEGYRSDSLVKTFGKLELEYLLNSSGFTNVRFLYPFPDYKVPDVVLKIEEKTYNSSDPFIYNFLNYEGSRDYSNRQVNLFQEFLVAKQIEANNLLPHMSNSFLVLASESEDSIDRYIDKSALAWKYNVMRAKKFMTQVSLRKDIKNGSLAVRREPLYPELLSTNEEINPELKHSPSENISFVNGNTLMEQILHAINSKKSNVEDSLRLCIQLWYDFLVQQGIKLLASETELPGNYIDCTPWNLIIAPEGNIEYIDQEWSYLERLPIKFILFRGLLGTYQKIYPLIDSGLDNLLPEKSFNCFLDYCLKLVSVQVRVDELNTFLELDWKFQEKVRLFPSETFDEYVKSLSLPLQSQVVGKVLERLHSQLQLAKIEVERLQFYLQEALQNAQAEREQFQFQLQQTQGEVERLQFYLQEALQNTQAEREQFQFQLQQNQMKLEQTQSELQSTQAELQSTQAELQSTQAELQSTQAELERSRFYLQETFQNIQAEREQFQLQLQQTQAELDLFKNEGIKGLLKRLAIKVQNKLKRATYILKHEGFRALLKQLKKKLQRQEIKPPSQDKNLLALSGINSEKFWSVLDPVIEEHRNHLREDAPKISILTPTWNSSLDWFIETALSVFNQTILNWEWCIVDDGSQTQEIRNVLNVLAQKCPKIKVEFQNSEGISAATNKALEISSGDYVCFLDHDDTLEATALQEVLDKLSEGFDVVYSDEDKIDISGRHYIEPFFKPDWSQEYFRGVMYVGHLLCVKRDLATVVGGFKSAYDGVQDYEFMLRISEVTKAIGHIPKILYHWRKIRGSIAENINAKPGIEKLQETAVNAHLERMRLSATAKSIGNHRLKIFPSVRSYNPLISIIIPTKDAPHHLEKCLRSIFTLTTYPNYEVVLVDNETADQEALQIMKQYSVKRLAFPNPFNYSRANNLGAKYAQGDYLVFLNNDTEVLTEDWLQYLLYYVEQPDIGAAGSLLLFPDKTVQHAGIVMGFRGTADHVMRGFPSNVDGYAGSLVCAREVSAVTAACMMVKKSDFEQIGGFNEHYFTHYQDVDLNMRLIEEGKKIIFTPHTVLMHYESATRKEYYDTIDRMLLLDQWQIYIDRGDPFYNPNFERAYYDYTIKQ